MQRIRKGDTVMVISGRDRGKTGKVLRVFPQKQQALVEGLNMVKQHMRRSQQRPEGGVVTHEAPLQMDKLQPLSKRDGRPTRVSFNVLSDGSKVRADRFGEAL